MSKKIRYEISYKGMKLLLLAFAIIYGLRMVFNYPWYDELYTYYSFISRGPVYAAIHWPLPNNHVGYSVLSGCLSYFGISLIALRGVSYLAAVFNVGLAYKIGMRLTEAYSVTPEKNRAFGFLCSVGYASLKLVHQISVQGRGYTLATTCYFIAIICIYELCVQKKVSRMRYLLIVLTLAGGIYIVPSSTFWVIPICLTGGAYLLFNKRKDTMWKLIIASLVAAVAALGLYAVIWLAIGSNLLSKTADSGFFGIYQIDIIKAEPLKALKTGLDYMLASPYIQSIDRKDAVTGLWDYLVRLFEQYYAGGGIIITVFLLLTGLLALVRFLKNHDRFCELFIAMTVFMLPLLLIIEAKQPYLRVFSYFGITLAVSVVWLLSLIKIPYKPVYLMGVLLFILFALPSYREQLAGRENDIHAALEAMEEAGYPVKEMESIHYTDDYEKYVIKYYYDCEINEAPVNEAEYLLIHDGLNGEWPDLYSSADFDMDYVSEAFDRITADSGYTVYRRKD